MAANASHKRYVTEMRGALTALCVCLTWIVAHPAYADDDAATKAAALEKAKKPKEAADQWEKSFETSKNPGDLFHAATDRKKAGDVPGATNDYARFLAALKPTDTEHKKEKGIATKAIAAAQKSLGRLALRATGSSKITVDGVSIDMARSEEWYVSVGPHVVEAKFETGVGKETATAVKGSLVPVVIAAPVEGEGGTPADKPKDDPVVDKPTDDKPVVAVNGKSGDRFTLPPFWFYILGGVTVVAGGLTVLSGIDVGSKKSDFDKAKTPENLDAGKSAQTRTNILLITTGVLAVGTGAVAVFLVDWKRTDTKLGIGPGSFVLQGTF